MRIIVTTAFAGLLLAGCAGVLTQSCPAGLKEMTQADLYFGRDIAGGGTVSDADWQNFVDAEVTPRFPDGLTVADVSGQWKGSSGIVREKSKRLTIVLSGAPDEQAKIEAIRSAYKLRFKQDAVLLLEYRACASF